MKKEGDAAKEGGKEREGEKEGGGATIFPVVATSNPIPPNKFLNISPLPTTMNMMNQRSQNSVTDIA